jgi:hypothetical protein
MKSENKSLSGSALFYMNAAADYVDVEVHQIAESDLRECAEMLGAKVLELTTEDGYTFLTTKLKIREGNRLVEVHLYTDMKKKEST